ncbi:MAG: hypothetical protein B7733_01130 [Myxococcales bacterium FL481]|nr:MAG: hypothetical protein B7733_01130 [Myxococcales bacterium FL481]
MSVATNHYNLIVLGGDLAGLVAAALAANRGLRVLVIPTRPITGTYSLGGRAMPIDPVPLVQLDSPAVRRSCEELGLWPQIRRALQPAAARTHWVTDGHRLDIELGAKNLAREAAREWPDVDVMAAWHRFIEQVQTVNPVFEDLLGSGEQVPTAERFWTRRFLDRTASRLPRADFDLWAPVTRGHPLASVSDAVTSAISDLSPESLGAGAKIRLLSQWHRGPFDRMGGLAGLRELLITRIRLKSGEVKSGLRVADVLLKRGRVVGIQLLGKTDRYGCDHLVLAEDPRSLVGGAWLAEHLPRPLARSLAGIDVTACRFVMNLTVEPRGLGPGLDGLAVWAPRVVAPGKRPPLGATMIRRSDPLDDGAYQLSVSTLVAPGASLDDQAERLLEELEDQGVLPWLRRHIRVMHSPHDGLPARDGHGRVAPGVGANTAMRLPMSALFRGDTSGALGVGLLPAVSGARNLHLASRLTLPGLGVEGEFVAGLGVASVVAPPKRPTFGRTLFLGRGR